MTNAEFAILGLIAEAPRHGYDIEQTIEMRGMREWTDVGFSSIYYILKKLEKNDLIRGRNVQAGGRGPARRVFTITAKGRDACRKETLSALSGPHRYHHPFNLGLANLPGVPPLEALSALRKNRDALSARHEHIVSQQNAKEPLPPVARSLFSYHLAIIRAEINWMEQFITKLEDEHGKN